MRIANISRIALAVALLSASAKPQVIEYENNGQKYQTLTRNGLTVIVTHMPNQIAGFAMMQVSVANGSQIYWTVKPEEFSYEKTGSTPLNAMPANTVINQLLAKASHGDVVKLVKSYESALYGIPNMRSTNGYEERRQSALSMGASAKLQAAAMASAIALATTRVPPGQSTDGAVFFPVSRELKTLSGGKLTLRVEGETFEFNPE